jgi:hypothetical protein
MPITGSVILCAGSKPKMIASSYKSPTRRSTSGSFLERGYYPINGNPRPALASFVRGPRAARRIYFDPAYIAKFYLDEQHSSQVRSQA